MGSGQSVKRNVEGQRVCPKDYDKTKFNMILELYDKLDNNGDNVISTEELINIADLHVKNRITMLMNAKDDATNYWNRDMNMLVKEKKKRIEQLNREFVRKEKDCTNDYRGKMEHYDSIIKTYNNMNDEEKNKQFINSVMKGTSRRHIDFWKFFEYMKNRTKDIKNITGMNEENDE